jgi:hypothetical protein
LFVGYYGGTKNTGHKLKRKWPMFLLYRKRNYNKVLLASRNASPPCTVPMHSYKSYQLKYHTSMSWRIVELRWSNCIMRPRKGLLVQCCTFCTKNKAYIPYRKATPRAIGRETKDHVKVIYCDDMPAHWFTVVILWMRNKSSKRGY